MRLNSPEAQAEICVSISVSLEGGVSQARELAEETMIISLAEVVRCLEWGLLEDCIGVGVQQRDLWRESGTDNKISNGWRGSRRTKGGREMKGARAVTHEQSRPLRTVSMSDCDETEDMTAATCSKLTLKPAAECGCINSSKAIDKDINTNDQPQWRQQYLYPSSIQAVGAIDGTYSVVSILLYLILACTFLLSPMASNVVHCISSSVYTDWLSRTYDSAYILTCAIPHGPTCSHLLLSSYYLPLRLPSFMSFYLPSVLYPSLSHLFSLIVCYIHILYVVHGPHTCQCIVHVCLVYVVSS